MLKFISVNLCSESRIIEFWIYHSTLTAIDVIVIIVFEDEVADDDALKEAKVDFEDMIDKSWLKRNDLMHWKLSERMNE